MISLEQFVYGRVSKGFGGQAGYQVAAAGRALSGQSTLIATLQSLSHYPELKGGAKAPPRFFMADAGEGWITFGRSGYAKDLTGRIGYFSHHLLARRDDIRKTGSIPITLLRTYPYYTAEADLPDDRVLPSIQESPDPASLSLMTGPSKGRVLNTLDALIKGETATPTLISDTIEDDKVLLFVETVLTLVPLQIALQTPVCINFGFSLDNLTRFRLVTAQDRSMLPAPEREFALIPHEREHSISGYTRYIEQADVQTCSHLLTRFSGHGPCTLEERLESLRHDTASKLVQALESTWQHWNREELLAHPLLAVRYYLAIPGFPLDDLYSAFEQTPATWFDVLIQQTRPDIPDTLIRWSLQVLTGHSGDPRSLTESLCRHELFDRFLDNGIRLPLDQATILADRVIHVPTYDGCFHHAVALRILTLSAAERRPWHAWIHQVSQPTVCANAVLLFDALASLAQRRFPRDFPDVDTLSRQEYAILVQHLARLGADKRQFTTEEFLRLLAPAWEMQCGPIFESFLAHNAQSLLTAAKHRNMLSPERIAQVVNFTLQNRLKRVARILLEPDFRSLLRNTQREHLQYLASGILKRLFGSFVNPSSSHGDSPGWNK